MATALPTDPQEDLKRWGGYMFRQDRTATPKLDALLRGIAKCISHQYEKSDHSDLTPSALAAFYRAVGGSYDQLFLQMHPQSIAFIYKNLGCPHSLQPSAVTPTTYSDPTVPALKPHGFTVWQSIQLLLGPAEHVPFVQEALRLFDVRDPDTGEAFPKQIPEGAFPMYPDPKMVAWHASVSDSLRLEAQQPREAAVRPLSPTEASDVSTDGTAETNERNDAAHFFANPLYRNKEGRPAIVRQLTRAPGRVFQGGKAVAQNVFHGGKMILSPNTFGGAVRKKSRSRSPSPKESHHRSHGYGAGDRHTSETAGRTPPSGSKPASGHQSRKAPRTSRRATSPTTSEDDKEDMERDRRRRLRRHRSHEGQSNSDVHDSDSKVRRHHTVHHPSSSAVNKEHSRERRSAPSNITRRNDLENQIPRQTQRPQAAQPAFFNNSPPAPSSGTNSNPQQQFYSNLGSSPNSQYHKDYSLNLRQQQQSQAAQAQARAQSIPHQQSPPSSENPQPAQQGPRPSMSYRTSSADRRSWDARKVSFADSSTKDEGYTSNWSDGIRRTSDVRSGPSPLSARPQGRPSPGGYEQSPRGRPTQAKGVQAPPRTEEWSKLPRYQSSRSRGRSKSSEGEMDADSGSTAGFSPSREGLIRDLTTTGGYASESALPGPAVVVNGVKGRRYPNFEPWAKEL